MLLGRESLANHDHIPKKALNPQFVRVKAFPMYGGIGVSAPSLHRESTDSDDQSQRLLSLHQDSLLYTFWFLR